MVYCDPIDLPDEIVTAQEQGQLVVFAGAGVSMDTPSSLPGFGQLTELIAQNTPHTVRKPYDEFLGDLVEAGVKVHDLCHKFINVPGSAPTPLHLDLVRLFRRPEWVRVVTTNFDAHFTAAAQAAGWQPPVYHAPALPLGHDFHGIVHLHGSLLDEPRRMVLTDADFGQAYLTDAWASIFLRSLFTDFVVLFVGYSHTDPPMRYLARGLAGRRRTRRYALVQQDDEAKWRPLGIVPVGYPLQTAPDEHGLLGKGIRRWLEITELQPLEIEARLQAILTAPENIEPNRSETDFLRRCLLRDATAQYFERHAAHPRWLDWLHREKLLGGYLVQDRQQADLPDDEQRSRETAERRIAKWVGRTLVGMKDGHGLWLVEQNGGRLSELVASEVAYRLSKDDTLNLGDPVAANWIALVMQCPGPPRRADMFGALLRKLVKHKLWPMALRLLAHCCETEIILEPSFSLQETPEPRTASGRIQLAHGTTSLSDIWRTGLQPAFPELAPALLNLVVKAVENAHRLAESLGLADRQSSAFLHTRSRIQSSSPYTRDADFSVVITWLSDVVAHLAAANGMPPAQVETWLAGGNPVLHRIGIHALTLAANLDSSGKFALIRRHGLVFTPVSGARHELYALLKSIYSGLTPAERTELWQLISAGPPAAPLAPGADPERVARRRQGLIDRLVTMLYAAYPNDPEGIAAYTALAQRSPDFVKADHVHIDLDFWSGEVRDLAALTPRTVDDLLKTEPADELEYLLSFRATDPLGDTREGLVSAVSSAAAKSPTWGVKLMRSLAVRGVWNSDIWPSLFWKIAFLDFPDSDQDWLVAALVAPLSEHDDALNALTHCLLNGSLFAKDKPARPALLAALAEASLQLWAKVRVAPTADDQAKLRGTDWLELGINRPPGRIVEFWLRYADSLRQGVQPAPQEWPQVLASAFDQIALAETPADWQGLALIGCHLSFVRAIVPDWTRRKIYPWLDFGTAGDRAWPCFHAFITYGRFQRDLLLELPQLFPAAVTIFSLADERHLRSFVSAVGIVIYSGLWEVTKSGWLRGILLGLTADQRRQFASNFANVLRDIAPEAMQKLWIRWMHAYWQERLQGRPVVLTADENGEMLGWAWHLPGPEFAVAATMLVNGPKPAISQWLPMEFLLETKLPEDAPAALLDVWYWMLSITQSYYADKADYLSLLVRLPRQPALIPKWEKVCNELSRHGLGFAHELLAAGQQHFVVPSTPTAGG